MCNDVMKYYPVHNIMCALIRRGLVLSLPVVLLLGDISMCGDDSVGSRGSKEVGVNQKALNESLGAPLINSPDSSISHENTNFTEETL